MSFAVTERERAVLDFLRRCRFATMSVVTTELCGGSESVAKKLMARLKDYGLIAADPLGTKTVVYRLTAAGAKLIGAPEEIGRPGGPQALPKQLGITGFCHSGSVKRERYLRPEFVEDFPDLAKSLLGKDYHTDFFLDADNGHVRLGQIVVDLGGDYKKLILKCRVRLREYLDMAHVRDVVAEGLFTFAIVVAEEEKAQAIRLAVREKPLKARVIVESSTELQKCPIQIGGEE